MINKLRELYPQANITPIDYDPSATRVNQENRIKLMLAVARERLAERTANQVGQTVVSADGEPEKKEVAV
jgi:predicted nucleotide-binding protein (sugar kinase/HSP70/actin superfamily)